MSLRVTQVNQNATTQENNDPLGYETTFDGQTFFWAPGQQRAFGDDGQGLGHAANSGAGSPAAAVVADDTASKKADPVSFPARS